MPDYSKHRLQNWDWYKQYRSQMGDIAFEQYVTRCYVILQTMQPGGFLVIDKNVRPENVDLFIKICCMFIDEHNRYSHTARLYYEFKSDYSEIRCFSNEIHRKNIKKYVHSRTG